MEVTQQDVIKELALGLEEKIATISALDNVESVSVMFAGDFLVVNFAIMDKEESLSFQYDSREFTDEVTVNILIDSTVEYLVEALYPAH